MNARQKPPGTHLKIKSRTDRLREVRDFVSACARDLGFRDDAVHKIALCCDEACTNVIKHSYANAPDRDIDIRVIPGEKGIEIVITHDGKSFDPDEIKSPDMQEYLAHYRKGGLGLHLIRSLMDKVYYRQGNGAKCEVHLVKQLPGAGGARKDR
jgi:serine/threonine-protein kinase RsbW